MNATAAKYGSHKIVFIRTCDVCGDTGATYVQTPGKVTAYGDDGWECLCPVCVTSN